MLHSCIFVYSCISGVEEIWNKKNKPHPEINEGKKYEKQESLHYAMPDIMFHLENLMN